MRTVGHSGTSSATTRAGADRDGDDVRAVTELRAEVERVRHEHARAVAEAGHGRELAQVEHSTCGSS